MRDEIERLEGRDFDVVVVGGGVNGASSARELAKAGYRVLIVDKGDFGSGASSRSSRLLHCGLRYLATGRSPLDFLRHPARFKSALRMARLGMEARSELVAAALHRTDRMRLHFPIYRDGPYRGWQVGLAFRALGLMGPRDPPLDYRRLDLAEARTVPLVRELRDFDRLDSVAAYREYQIDWPERVGIDAILEAEGLGAVARNYTKARLRSHETGRGWTVELTDMPTQSAPVRVTGRFVFNMAGVWIDDVLRDANPKAGRKIYGTKGAHIVVRLPEDCRAIGIATLNSEGEPLYCLPWKDLHYFGPTETPYEGDLDRVFVTAGEQAWLLGEANRLLPSLRLSAGDVVMTWAGVRPLTYDAAVPFGDRTRRIHDLAGEGLPDAFAMTAGPVMTHRSAGREMAGVIRARLPPAHREPSGAAPLRETGLEHAVHLSDVLFRRRGLAWSGPIARPDLDRLAREAGSALGWDAARMTNEIASFEREWTELFGPRSMPGGSTPDAAASKMTTT